MLWAQCWWDSGKVALAYEANERLMEHVQEQSHGLSSLLSFIWNFPLDSEKLRKFGFMELGYCVELNSSLEFVEKLKICLCVEKAMYQNKSIWKLDAT